MNATATKGTTMAKGGFTVTGPGVDRNGFTAGPVALSAAITIASRSPGETTLYVRDSAGEAFGRVERDAGGALEIWRTKEASRG